MTRRWVIGLVVGIAAGTGTIAGGAIGGSLGISAIGLAVAESPRAAAVGGALVGFGGSWLVLFGRVLVMCDAGCVPPDLRPWLAIGAALAGLGALATFRTRRGA